MIKLLIHLYTVHLVTSLKVKHLFFHHTPLFHLYFIVLLVDLLIFFPAAYAIFAVRKTNPVDPDSTVSILE